MTDTDKLLAYYIDRIAELEKLHSEDREYIEQLEREFEFKEKMYKEQIEKMKNCSNCKYFKDDEFCKLDGRENYCRWELKEDD